MPRPSDPRGDFEQGEEVGHPNQVHRKDLGIRPDLIRRLSIANFEAEYELIMHADRRT